MKPRFSALKFINSHGVQRVWVLVAAGLLASATALAQFVPLKADVKKPPTSTIHGFVKDASGTAVSEAPVIAILRGEESERQSLAAVTDKQGGFSFADLDEGYWCISVDDERFAREWEYERSIEIPAPAETMPLAIQLAPPQEISGVVHDERGAPVEGARVTMNREWLVGAEGPVQGHATNDLQIATTDAHGAFAFTRLRPGTISMVLEHANFAQTRVYELKTGTAGSVLTINDGTTLSGKVVNGDSPVPAVKVAVWTLNESHRPWGRWETTTAADGSFSVPHVPNLSQYAKHDIGQFYVQIKEAGWKSDYFRLYQYEDNLLPSLTVAVSRGDAEAYEAKMIDVGKRALDGPGPGGTVRVTLRPESTVNSFDGMSVSLSSCDQREKSFFNHAKVNETGLAVFEHVPPGEYGVWMLASEMHFEAQSLTVRPRQTTEVALKRGSASLRGRLVGAIDTGGKRHVSWFLSDPPFDLPAQGGARFNDDGTYEIEGLTPGRYRLIYEGSGIMKNYFVTNVSPGANHFDLTLASSRIDGRVVGIKLERDAHGIGTIRLLPTNTTVMSGNLVGYTDPDENGEFHFNNVPPGRYVVSARDRATDLTLMTNLVVASNSGNVAVELSPPERIGSIEGHITNLQPANKLDAIFRSLSISAIPLTEYGYEFASGYWTSIDEKTGHYVFKNMAEGIYGLLIGSASKLPAMWMPGVEVRDGMANIHDITLAESRMVNIRVDRGGFLTPKAIWRLRMADQTEIKYDYFVGSGPEGTAAPPTDFLLSCGQYTIEADFGDDVRAELPINVETGEGVQEFVVYHPALQEAAAVH